MSGMTMRISRNLAAVLVVAAAIAPGASAKYAVYGGPSSGLTERTPTELAQSSTGVSTVPTPGGESGGLGWNEDAIVVGGVLVLIAVGGTTVLLRRRGAIRKPGTPVISS